jgi:hypothetical protein
MNRPDVRIEWEVLFDSVLREIPAIRGTTTERGIVGRLRRILHRGVARDD